MSIEAILAAVTPVDQRGRVSAWFQAGNLGGAGLGGGLGLVLLQNLPAPWMAGAIMGALFMACCGGLLFVPDVAAHPSEGGSLEAVKGVVRDMRVLLSSKEGFLAAFLCFLPIGTGAAGGVLTQASVAAQWGASDNEVALLQGFLAAGVTAAGCFVGGWICDRLSPRTAYALIGAALALVAVGMALSPQTVAMYVVWNLLYSAIVGLSYAAFTAVVLEAIGAASAATKYNVFASLSNFPIWWLGLALGAATDAYGPRGMLFVEAGFGLAAAALFLVVTRVAGRRAA